MLHYKILKNRNLIELATISNNGKSRMCKGNFVRKTWFELFAAGIVISGLQGKQICITRSQTFS